MKGFDSLAKLGKKTQPSQPQRSLHSSLFEPFFVRHMRLMGLIPWKSKDQWGSPAAGAGAAGAGALAAGAGALAAGAGALAAGAAVATAADGAGALAAGAAGAAGAGALASGAADGRAFTGTFPISAGGADLNFAGASCGCNHLLGGKPFGGGAGGERGSSDSSPRSMHWLSSWP